MLRLPPRPRRRRATTLLAVGAALVVTVVLPAPASAQRDTLPDVRRAIEQRYDELGGERELGAPLDPVALTPELPGGFQHYSSGASLYKRAGVGKAHLVYGEIKDYWAGKGWESSHYGFPISDEYADAGCGGGGRRTDFEGGYVCWTPDGGPQGRIRFNLKMTDIDWYANRQIRVTVGVGAKDGILDKVWCFVKRGDGPMQRLKDQNPKRLVRAHGGYYFYFDVPADWDKAVCGVDGHNEGSGNPEHHVGDNVMGWDNWTDDRWY